MSEATVLAERIARAFNLSEEIDGFGIRVFVPPDRTVPHVYVRPLTDVVLLQLYEGDHRYGGADLSLSVNLAQQPPTTRCSTRALPKWNRRLEGIRKLLNDIDALVDGLIVYGFRNASDQADCLEWLTNRPVQPERGEGGVRCQ